MKLKLFETDGTENFECPICGTNEKGKVFLVPQYNELNNVIQQADIIHLKCFVKFCEAKNEFFEIKDLSKEIHNIKQYKINHE